MSLFDHPLISARYFFPRPQPFSQGLLEVPVAGGDTLACYQDNSHPGAPTLLHFHGNGEVVADYASDLALVLSQIGLNVFLAEYRGYGGSSGSPSLAQMLDDVEPVLEATGVPAEQVLLYGRSVGSIYALELVRRHPEIGALIVESGIADPLERVLLRVTPDELGVSSEEVEQEARRLFDHKAKLATYPNPAVILHTRHDHLVDHSHAERLAAWAPQGELITFEEGDHNSILAYNAEQILEVVARLARGIQQA